VTPEPNSIDDLENAAHQGVNGEVSGNRDDPGSRPGTAAAGAGESATAPVGESAAAADAALADGEAPVSVDAVAEPEAEAAVGAPEAGQPSDGVLAEMAATLRELADASDRYHGRAEQREGVIDHLRSEVDVLRRGERRGLLRPVLADLCRLRDDLLKQAATLPSEFGPDKAADLLRSYAETIELTLESNGVVTYTPDCGDAFNPRMHRRIKGEPTADRALAGCIAGIQRDGYLDIEANSPIAPAEVTVYAVTDGGQEQ
jgi:molecular chaperone GrpE